MQLTRWRLGLVALLLVRPDASLLAQSSAASAQQNPRSACSSPEHRQFDFWVGKWDVYQTRTGKHVAQSLIEHLYDDCAIRENWMPDGGSGGGSLNSYLPDEKQWRQTWVDSMNSYAVFKGGLRDGAMVLQGKWQNAIGPGTNPLVRIRWTPGGGGVVRQFGEVSKDGGATWEPFFDLTYKPAT